MPLPSARPLGLSLLVLLGTSAFAAPPAPIRVPFTPTRWHARDPSAKLSFPSLEGFPDGLLDLKSGEAVLSGITFTDGTIEFDMHASAADIPGIRFRQQDPDNAEEFYLRSFPNARASNDAIQYAPVIHGFMLWNTYPQYQTSAPVLPSDWNHFKLVISGRRMNVFVNHSPAPTLSVGELLSPARSGGIELRGPATFGNLVVTPGATEGLSPIPAPDPSASDPGIVRHWLLSPLTPLPAPGQAPSLTSAPADPHQWHPVTAERFGLVNLNREFTYTQAPPALVWLRTTLTAKHDGPVPVSLGWIGEAWVFLNGKLITSGKNFYYPESHRRPPDGRLSLENGSFSLPLHAGPNDLQIALYSNVHEDSTNRTHYGWGLALRVDDPRAVTLPR